MTGEREDGGPANTHTFRLPMAAAMLGALAGVSISLDSGTSRRYRPSRYHCVRCLDEIPPGKPGRRCKNCRAKGNTP